MWILFETIEDSLAFELFMFMVYRVWFVWFDLISFHFIG